MCWARKGPWATGSAHGVRTYMWAGESKPEASRTGDFPLPAGVVLPQHPSPKFSGKSMKYRKWVFLSVHVSVSLVLSPHFLVPFDCSALDRLFALVRLVLPSLLKPPQSLGAWHRFPLPCAPREGNEQTLQLCKLSF